MDNKNPILSVSPHDIYVEATYLSDPYNLRELIRIKATDYSGQKNLDHMILINTRRVNFTKAGKYPISISVVDEDARMAFDEVTIHVIDPNTLNDHQSESSTKIDSHNKKKKRNFFTKWFNGDLSDYLPKKQQATTEHVLVQNDNSKMHTSKKKWPFMVKVCLLVILVVITISIMFILSQPQTNDHNYQSVSSNASAKTFNYQNDVLHNQLDSALVAYRKDDNKKEFRSSLNKIANRSKDLENSLITRGKDAKAADPLAEKIMLVQETTKKMKKATSPNEAQKAYNKGLGGFNRIGQAWATIVINL